MFFEICQGDLDLGFRPKKFPLTARPKFKSSCRKKSDLDGSLFWPYSTLNSSDVGILNYSRAIAGTVDSTLLVIMVTCVRNPIAQPVVRASCVHAGQNRVIRRPFVAYTKDARAISSSIGHQAVHRASVIICAAAQVGE